MQQQQQQRKTTFMAQTVSFAQTLLCSALLCLALPCSALCCLALPGAALLCLLLPCSALLCLVLPCSALCCLALPGAALCCLALPCPDLLCLAVLCKRELLLKQKLKNVPNVTSYSFPQHTLGRQWDSQHWLSSHQTASGASDFPVFIVFHLFVCLFVCLFVIIIITQANEFLKPPSLDKYPDYNEFVFKPMDLSILEMVCRTSINKLVTQ